MGDYVSMYFLTCERCLAFSRPFSLSPRLWGFLPILPDASLSCIPVSKGFASSILTNVIYERLACLVARHSEADFETALRGYTHELDAFFFFFFF